MIWWAGGELNSRPSDYESSTGRFCQFRRVPQRVGSWWFLGLVAVVDPGGSGLSRQVPVSLDTSWTTVGGMGSVLSASSGSQIRISTCSLGCLEQRERIVSGAHQSQDVPFTPRVISAPGWDTYELTGFGLKGGPAADSGTHLG